MATSEPVVLHHGREEGCRWRRGAAICFSGHAIRIAMMPKHDQTGA